MRVYIAGPYSNNPEENTRAAILAGHEAMDLGCDPFIPHLSHFSHKVKERHYEEWMRLDLAWLEQADVLWRIPGESPGAEREVARAKECGIPVVYTAPELARLVAEDLRAKLAVERSLSKAYAEQVVEAHDRAAELHGFIGKLEERLAVAVDELDAERARLAGVVVH